MQQTTSLMHQFHISSNTLINMNGLAINNPQCKKDKGILSFLCLEFIMDADLDNAQFDTVLLILFL